MLQTIEVLLNIRVPKCNPNLKNSNGNTPLHICVSKKFYQGIGVFLNCANVNLNVLNKYGNSPLYEAVITWVPLSVVKALLMHSTCNPNTKNPMTQLTPLNCAVNSGRMDYVELLIFSGKCCEEDVVKTMCNKAFMQNVFSQKYLRNCDLLKRFIESPRCRTLLNSAINGQTLLHNACSTSMYEAVKLLVDCGLSELDVNQKDHNGCTALHIIFTNKNIPSEIIDIFFKNKEIDLNSPNNKGNTPLHEAIIRGVSVSIVEMLVLHKNCDPNKVNQRKMTALQAAIDGDMLECAEVILKSNKCSIQDLLQATELVIYKLKTLDVMNILENLILTIPKTACNQFNSDRGTLLYSACKVRNYRAIELLLEAGANMQFSEDGNAPIHVTTDTLCLTLLLENDSCDPNQKKCWE